MFGTRERVTACIVGLMHGPDEDLVKGAANLREDLHMDSLDMVELELALESAFDISFEPQGLSARTVDDVVSAVEKLRTPATA